MYMYIIYVCIYYYMMYMLYTHRHTHTHTHTGCVYIHNCFIYNSYQLLLRLCISLSLSLTSAVGAPWLAPINPGGQVITQSIHIYDT